MRELSFAQAICEATDLCLQNTEVYIQGLGVPDPGAIFGTTKDLALKHGTDRVLDMPIAENGMLGIAIGAALAGMRPIITHQRVEFMLLAIEQLVNQAAKWHYMFNGQKNIPLVIRCIIGRGWGQGPQHSQSLHSWFAHIPGLKVVMPFTPYDAKGLLLEAVADNNPVVFLEHRWLHNLKGHVPEEYYTIPIGKAKILLAGIDLTIISVSYMSYEALQAAKELLKLNIKVEIIDIRTLRPLDVDCIYTSIKKTGRVLILDPDWSYCGFSAELIATICESCFKDLKCAPQRLTWPDYPAPTAFALTKNYYPGVEQIVNLALQILGAPEKKIVFESQKTPHDIPDLSFTGPF